MSLPDINESSGLTFLTSVTSIFLSPSSLFPPATISPLVSSNNFDKRLKWFSLIIFEKFFEASKELVVVPEEGDGAENSESARLRAEMSFGSSSGVQRM